MTRFFTSITFIIFVINVANGISVSDKIDFDTEIKLPPQIDSTTSSESCGDCSMNYKEEKKNFRSNSKAEDMFQRRTVPNKPKYPQNKPNSKCDNPVTVVNNIRIVLDSNEVLVIPGNQRSCQNNICDVSVTTTKDSRGNLVTTVHFNIITKIKNIKVHDVPVIDGVRGLSPDDYKSNYPNYKPSKPQIYRQNTNIFQPSYGDPKIYISRPHTDSYYSYNRGISTEESHEQGPWMTGRDTIDDKIKPPLSKTTMNVQ